MNDTWYLVIIIAVNLMWCFASLKINDDWYKHCQKMNQDWAETCRTIIKEQYQSEEANT